MTTRSLHVNVSANVAPYLAGMRMSAAETAKLAAAQQALAGQQVRTQAAMGRTGATATGMSAQLKGAGAQAGAFGAGMGRAGGQVATFAGGISPAVIGVAGLAYGLKEAVGASVEFEDQFANVAKTVDGTPAQLDAVAESIRRMSTEMPVAATELTDIAAVAGQLGVPIDNIEEFTSTIAMLASATDLAAEDAAFSFARIARLTNTPLENVDTLGSVVVRLGNNMAATEAEITEFALRIAGAGTTVGMTAAEIFGLSGMLAETGIRAEAGGTAISRVIIDIAEAVDEGGSKLTDFASAAGMSASQFAASWKSDPSGAIVQFVAGLAQVESQGESTFGTLEELGLADQRVRDALLRLATDSSRLSEVQGMVNDELANGSALLDEYGAKAGTTKSQWEVFTNGLIEDARRLGDTVLPVMKDVVTGYNEGREGARMFRDAVDGGFWSDWATVVGGAVSGTLRPATDEAVEGFTNWYETVEYLNSVQDRFSASATRFVTSAANIVTAAAENDGQLRTSTEVLDGLGTAVEGALKDRAVDWFADIAREAAGATASMQDYYDTIRAAQDPLFAYTDAIESVAEAQDALDAATADGAGTEERRRLLLDLYAAQTDVAASSDGLTAAFRDGTVSIGEVNRNLAAMVDANVITQAEAAETMSAILGLGTAAEETSGTYQVDMDTRTAEADERIAAFQARLDEVPPVVQTILDALPEPAQRAVLTVLGQFGLVPDEVSTELRAADAASGVIERIRGLLGGIPRNVTTTITTRRVTAPGFAAQGGGGGGGGIGSANGNILDFYADGGLHENHVAQFAPAGAMRLWAEPETGGEAYIPLAAEKRHRSVSIWEETGRRLGVVPDLSAQGGLALAQGGLALAAGGPIDAASLGRTTNDRDLQQLSEVLA